MSEARRLGARYNRRTMEREVRYCTTEDGVRIAYCVEGEGPPLVIVPAVFVAFSCDHLFPERQEFLRALARGRRIVQYDGRGSGLSQRDVDDVSAAARMLDLKAVVHAAGLRRVSIFTNAIGCLVAIPYAAAYPRRVDRLIIYSALERLPDLSDRAGLLGFAELARARWDIATQAIADLSGREEYPETVQRVAEWYRQSTTGEMGARFVLALLDEDVSPLVPRVAAPTLVLHRVDNRSLPIEVGRRIAMAMPNATFVPLPGTADLLETDPRAALEAIDRFLPKQPETAEPSAPPAPVRTVLFTDLAGSTLMMQRLGDERGREVLREHERMTREVLREHGGTEVKTMGDGFMASFGSVTKAVECAIALQRAFAERNAGVGAALAPPQGAASGAPTPPESLHIRIGLNAGEPIEEEGPDGRADLFGATVILAARIAAMADGGEVLASDVVRGLCAGKGFLFADRGEFVAKGFEEPVRLFEVNWRTG